MPEHGLLIAVRLYDGQFHGGPDWPPSPFRLFQALVAGAYGGQWRGEDRAAKDAAFRWLEGLPPPLISAPPRTRLSALTTWVPNNDLDAVAGDPRRVAEIRAAKTVRASCIARDEPILYLWPFDDGDSHAQRLAKLTHRLHTFGHGVDAAAADADLLSWADAERRMCLRAAPARPEGPGAVRCPMPGSLDSLHATHDAFLSQLSRDTGINGTILFRRPPKPAYRGIAYDRPPSRLLFDLRDRDDPRRFRPVAQMRAVEVATAVRDCLHTRLVAAIPDRVEEIARLVLGYAARPADLERRVRIVPLPTIGFVHADPAIRRVLIEVPPDCPLAVADIVWALSNRALSLLAGNAILTPAETDAMLGHYGIKNSAACWRTVTPVVLPTPRRSGRIGGLARLQQDATCAASVSDALRHAGMEARGCTIRVQREPWTLKGERAEAFAADRFASERLMHVELAFPAPVTGPVLIGDGRFLGLGLMQPIKEKAPPLHRFALLSSDAPLPRLRDAVVVSRALRRAVMACLAAEQSDDRVLPPIFTGHAFDGAPLRSGRHEHLFFAADDEDGDGAIDHVLVIGPELADRRGVRDGEAMRQLAHALRRLTVLRVPGRPALQVIQVASTPDSNCTWCSRTPYCPTRFPKRGADPTIAVIADIRAECARRGLPSPSPEVTQIARGRRGGLAASVVLHFSRPVQGPILLGRDSHYGQGLFVPRSRIEDASRVADTGSCGSR